ncbi:hypothetical protein KUCAC02_000309 [Chaenocephalus aceratus]|uniref:Uncharacterized protein n=1 Tax=Chaenocephalus aceratus TaxID=36190 RepID=A0ACB9W604_CHAAC|nr:hypothetical protein KUCAC02_000309 [Chaenocephalus aceratus]
MKAFLKLYFLIICENNILGAKRTSLLMSYRTSIKNSCFKKIDKSERPRFTELWYLLWI